MMEEKEKAWKTVSSKYLFRRPWLTVRCEDMLLPNGNHIPEYYILEYPDWVNTIAITKDGKFVFVRQYRPGLGRTSYDECVQWTCDMFDDAAGRLPATRTGSEYGLATSVAAKALKARLLLYAASPLFNGNTEYYSDFVNTDGS